MRSMTPASRRKCCPKRRRTGRRRLRFFGVILDTGHAVLHECLVADLLEPLLQALVEPLGVQDARGRSSAGPRRWRPAGADPAPPECATRSPCENGCDSSPSSALFIAAWNSGTKASPAFQPRSPPTRALPGSSECSLASSAKSSPARMRSRMASISDRASSAERMVEGLSRMCRTSVSLAVCCEAPRWSSSLTTWNPEAFCTVARPPRRWHSSSTRSANRLGIRPALRQPRSPPFQGGGCRRVLHRHGGEVGAVAQFGDDLLGAGAGLGQLGSRGAGLYGQQDVAQAVLVGALLGEEGRDGAAPRCPVR